MPEDFEDVSGFHLSGEREETLLSTQTECTFMWSTKSGEPVGVIMNFVWANDRFWLTATRRRKRISAIERDPRVALAISSRGTNIGISQAVTYKGIAIVHGDTEITEWFYPILAARVRPDSIEKQQAFVNLLRSPGRVVIEVVPSTRIGFDSQAMFADTKAGATQTMLD
jgi:Pyridoxamine 5'-phosphate oxidase